MFHLYLKIALSLLGLKLCVLISSHALICHLNFLYIHLLPASNIFQLREWSSKLSSYHCWVAPFSWDSEGGLALHQPNWAGALLQAPSMYTSSLAVATRNPCQIWKAEANQQPFFNTLQGTKKRNSSCTLLICCLNALTLLLDVLPQMCVNQECGLSGKVGGSWPRLRKQEADVGTRLSQWIPGCLQSSLLSQFSFPTAGQTDSQQLQA